MYPNFSEKPTRCKFHKHIHDKFFCEWCSHDLTRCSHTTKPIIMYCILLWILRKLSPRTQSTINIKARQQRTALQNGWTLFSFYAFCISFTVTTIRWIITMHWPEPESLIAAATGLSHNYIRDSFIFPAIRLCTLRALYLPLTNHNTFARECCERESTLWENPFDVYAIASPSPHSNHDLGCCLHLHIDKDEGA